MFGRGGLGCGWSAQEACQRCSFQADSSTVHDLFEYHCNSYHSIVYIIYITCLLFLRPIDCVFKLLFHCEHINSFNTRSGTLILKSQQKANYPLTKQTGLWWVNGAGSRPTSLKTPWVLSSTIASAALVSVHTWHLSETGWAICRTSPSTKQHLRHSPLLAGQLDSWV